MSRFTGNAAERGAQITDFLERIAAEASSKYPRNGLDLVVYPEYALQAGVANDAVASAVGLDDPVLAAIGDAVRKHRTWVVLPMFLRDPDGRASNAAVLLNREGGVAGVYRKVHPVADGRGILEGGVTPGIELVTFDCDFGRLGILICYDMSYDGAWQAVAAQRPEIVALPSASPQNVRPAAEAQRNRFYVVTATPRDNVTIFDPIGMVVAQSTADKFLVREIDLAYAVLHWTASLQDGRAFTRKFGDKVGYTYSVREDTGVFWSNTPEMSIGAMAKELGLREMGDALEYSRQFQDQARRPESGRRPENLERARRKPTWHASATAHLLRSLASPGGPRRSAG
jgi:predicted amidohydrolase